MGSWLALGLVLVALAFAIALPRITEGRITKLRNDINEVAAPARQRVTQIQLDMALEAAQRRGFLLTGDPRVTVQVADSRARRRQAERELLEYARRLDGTAPGELMRSAEQLRELGRDMDSLLTLGESGNVSAAALREQRQQFLVIQALADTLGRAIDRASDGRRDAIRKTEDMVALLTGISLFLGFGAAFVVARLGSRFRAIALSLDASESWARQLAESERAARTAVEQRERELVRVTESRARLLRGFTHDVKNPLGAADGYLAMVEEGIYGEMEDKPRGIVTKVRRSIGQALELIKQLLDIARAEAGQLEIRRQEIDLKELVRDIADSFAAQAKAKAITLTVEPQNNLPNVYTDGTRVRQVVGNLVSNAVKYTPQGGNVVVRVQERTGAGPDARNAACIAVSDDGPGIPPDKLPMLFKEFSRFDAGAAEGAGIGLAISQKIAEALAGEIRVESDGAGSTFSFCLPAGDRRGGDVRRRGDGREPRTGA
jgi:signal transduction histidine kinase